MIRWLFGVFAFFVGLKLANGQTAADIYVGIVPDTPSGIEDGKILSTVVNYLTGKKATYKELVINGSVELDKLLCSFLNSTLSTESVVGVVSTVNDTNMVDAVKNFAASSGVPVIQIERSLWTLGKNPLATYQPTNYIRLEHPDMITFGALKSYFDLMAIKPQEVVLLYDDNYPEDAWVHGAIEAQVGVISAKTTMPTTASGLQSVLDQLKSTNITHMLFMSSMKNFEALTLVAGDAGVMSKVTQKVLFYTRDPYAYHCTYCISLVATWVRPAVNDQYHQLFRDYKDFVELEKIHKFAVVDELNAAMLLDAMRFIHSSWANRKSGYSCTAKKTTDLAKDINSFLTAVNHTYEGPYGKYQFAQPNMMYQNIAMMATKMVVKETARYLRTIGNWSVADGMGVTKAALDANIEDLSHLRIVTIQQPPFIGRNKKTNELEGYCIDLLKQIQLSPDINFTYAIYEVPDKAYGSVDGFGEWNGLIRELIDGKADVALAPLSVMAERENNVDFTVPYYDLVGIQILMKKPEEDYSIFRFMTVLEAPVWGCIVGAYFFTSILLWLFDKFSPYSYSNNREKYKDDHEKREFTLKECFWFCMTSLTPQGGGEAPKNISGRLVAATWWLFGFIIIASYTANLAAFLTVSRLDNTITSLDDLAKQYKIRYAPVKGTATETYFKRMAEIEQRFYDIWKEMSLNSSMTPEERAQLAVWDYPVSDKYTNIWRFMQDAGLPNSTQSAIDKVLASKSTTEGFALIGDATEVRYAELTDCKVRAVGSEFSRKPYAIAVQQGSPLKDKFSSVILHLLNNRKLETLKETWWNENPNKVVCSDSSNSNNGISVQNIAGVFIVILIGIGLSVITLVFEYFYYKDKRQTKPSVTNGNHSGQNDVVHVATVQPIDSKPGQTFSIHH